MNYEKVIGEENGYFVLNNERLHTLLKVQLEISLFQLGEFLNCFFVRMDHEINVWNY